AAQATLMLPPPPGGAVALALDVVAVAPPASGHLRVYPAGLAQPPLASFLNYDGQTVASAGVVTLGGGVSDLAVWSQRGLDLVIDATGVFKAPGADTLRYYPIAPCRVDDRVPLAGGMPQPIDVQGTCGVPVGARAIAAYLMVLDPAAEGYLVAYPSGTAK